LKAPSFKDPAVVKASDADLIAAVTNGKGKMPANKGKLTDAQIKAAIAYIRTLQK
jgi:mono/diheme cytochrome c family protein